MAAHSRSSFFKYVTAETALRILQNRSLRWSSPILFNDPFDVPRELVFGATPSEIHAKCAELLISLITSPPSDKSNYQPKIRMILEAVERSGTEALKNQLIEGIKDVESGFSSDGEHLEALREQWRNLIPEFRIFCLTDNPYRVSMWYHYAEKYAGAVIELKCVAALDSAWLSARPVSYPTDKPELYTAEGWAKLLMMPNQDAIAKILDTATFTKSPDWSYESEWRITSFKRPTDIGAYTDYRFSKEELGALYLGPLVSDTNRQALISAVSQYPDTRALNVEIGMNREFIVSAIDG